MKYTEMTYEQLLEVRLEVNQLIADIERKAYDTISTGEPVKGFRLKEGRKQRKVKNEGLLVQALRGKGIANGDIYDAKLKGVPALEKMFAKRFSESDAAILMAQHIETTLTDPKLEYVGV
ncbi:protein of unknown function DUF2800 [Vibrio phage vB_VhaP_PG11]|nr:protein of unknown function DUF2800 [Vibrio phage vB_VhaP_PG11]